MRKILMTAAFCLGLISTIHAQQITEDFSSNSLGWNECASESESGKAIIDKGKLTIISKGVRGKFLAALAGISPTAATYFTCFCYAPIDVTRTFTISTNVKFRNLDDDQMAGLVFNYKDDGNFYAYIFNDNSVRFIRMEDNRLVGSITQSMKWSKTRKATQNWELSSEGDALTFIVDGVSVMKTRYMPLKYNGFGFYTFGKQTLEVSDVTFNQ